MLEMSATVEEVSKNSQRAAEAARRRQPRHGTAAKSSAKCFGHARDRNINDTVSAKISDSGKVNQMGHLPPSSRRLPANQPAGPECRKSKLRGRAEQGGLCGCRREVRRLAERTGSNPGNLGDDRQNSTGSS